MPSSDNRNGAWLSPVIPTIGNVALSLLWAFSAFGGWGVAAFCESAGSVDAACRAGFGTTVAVSVPVAVLAAALGLAAWSLPRVRRRPDRLGGALLVAASGWVVAEAVLFAGGWLVQP